MNEYSVLEEIKDCEEEIKRIKAYRQTECNKRVPDGRGLMEANNRLIELKTKIAKLQKAVPHKFKHDTCIKL